MPSIALLISTYNWPEALALILKSALQQTKMPNEIVIADDGSKNETKVLIDSFRDQFKIPIKHVWHEDKGFRKSLILNKAIAEMSSDYIVQIDGDCIMHPSFIADHAALAEPNVYLYGSRVNIQKPFLSQLFTSQQIKFSPFSKGIKKRTRAIHAPFLSSFYKKNNTFSRKLRGCNVSYWRKDAITINGYNEDMEGWGREDSEFILRLINIGILGRRLRYRGIVYHIWHQEKSKDQLPENDAIEQHTIKNNIKRCENGIDKYLNPSSIS
ncbi:glycosyltransferase family 2 protein [Aquimarina rhabdastrellae]